MMYELEIKRPLSTALKELRVCYGSQVGKQITLGQYEKGYNEDIYCARGSQGLVPNSALGVGHFRKMLCRGGEF